jgi:hypothetical protein
LCSYPVLTCYDPKLTLVLDTDYQKNAISAILGMRNPDFKREQVIKYASRTLNALNKDFLQLRLNWLLSFGDLDISRSI